MSDDAQTTTEEQQQQPQPVQIQPVTVADHTRRFFSREEMCLQLVPGLTTARGRNTAGLWLVGGPLVVLLLLKAMFRWPSGLLGWAWLLIVAASFALVGAGMMEWGLSPDGDAAKVPTESWIYMGIGGGILVLLLLGHIFVAYGRASGRFGAKDRRPALVADSED
jgi:hypothetical protein